MRCPCCACCPALSSPPGSCTARHVAASSRHAANVGCEACKHACGAAGPTELAPSLFNLLLFTLPQQWSLALPTLAVSAATDWADGYAARRLSRPSVIGSYLDPLADKVLIGCVVAALGASVSGWVVGWRPRAVSSRARCWQ